MTGPVEILATAVMARRRRSRRFSLLFQAGIAALVLWSLEAIVIGDTDWSRITLASVGRALGRFAE